MRKSSIFTKFVCLSGIFLSTFLCPLIVVQAADDNDILRFLPAILAGNNHNVAGNIHYGTVTLAGQVWLDRNLGASRIAASATDEQAYGDLYQWGRATDGHEKRNSLTSSQISTKDNPDMDDYPENDGKFITPDHTTDRDWRYPHNHELWQGESGINNPCPAGFRLPTITDFRIALDSSPGPLLAVASNSSLKLVLGGQRNSFDGTLTHAATEGWYWTSTIGQDPNWILFLQITQESPQSSTISTGPMTERARGQSVRCIKD